MPSEQDIAAFEKQERERRLVDFANLAKYHDADAQLAPPAPDENRVVFMGDSITEGWGQKNNPLFADLGDFFPGKPYVNRGISGQTTPQMLVRFRQDVIRLSPKVVVILAGVNDIAGNTGPTTLDTIETNIRSMSDLARANGIHVVLCSVLPTTNFWWRKGAANPADKIRALNRRIRSFASAEHIVYVDYYSRMVNSEGGLKAEYSPDGVHPVRAGYDVMAPLVEAGIQQALKQSAQ